MADTLFECHGHIFLNGGSYAAAAVRHRSGADTSALRANLAALQAQGVSYFRDGGDPFGVSLTARALAADYGIDFVTPAFAIFRKGHYGGIVGRPYDDMVSYRRLVGEAAGMGADYIKLMLSGLVDFAHCGTLSSPSLPSGEIRELIHIAHGEGFHVMAHVNGADTIRAAIEAGVDSIEHGCFMDAACLDLLAASDTIWVPTLAAFAAFTGREGFDTAVTERVYTGQCRAVSNALSRGVLTASGSDAGAVGVPMDTAAQTEYRLLKCCGHTDAGLSGANERIRRRFKRQ